MLIQIEQKIFLIGTFIFLIMNDISSNSLGTFSHHSINALVPASIEIIWGHILYKYQKIFTRKLAIPVSIFLFFSLNYLRSLIQLHRYSLETPNNYILFWYSSIGIICVSCRNIYFLLLCHQSTWVFKHNSKIHMLAGLLYFPSIFNPYPYKRFTCNIQCTYYVKSFYVLPFFRVHCRHFI